MGAATCVDGAVSCVANFNPAELNEICNDFDDDCDGEIDEGLPLEIFYKDDDSDGVGSEATAQACKAPVGYAEKSGDCNDNNANIYPGAVELCNDGDDNCNGFSDEGVQKPIFYKDNDGDGFGGATLTFACQAPMGFVVEGGDCNDFNKNIGPSAPEVCDDLDNDCNGLVDDGLPTDTIYKDNDGDGIAPLGALNQQKCNVPIGWTSAKDIDGDNSMDWDCNDSDVTVRPGASTVCDGKDNDCDGVIDRLCFTPCGGSWPYQPVGAQHAIYNISRVDLDGDGYQEVIYQSAQGFAILDHQGKPLHAIQGSLNFSRRPVALADLDTYDQHGSFIQTLEVLGANESKPSFYFINPDKTVKVVNSPLDSFDASQFLVADVDKDGIVEFFTSSWCHPDRGTRIFRYNRSTDTIVLARDIPDPDGACEYDDGRLLTDIDGDGNLEYIFGNGYGHASQPSLWKGRIYTHKFTDLATLAGAPFCDPATCFQTTTPNFVQAELVHMWRFGNEFRAMVHDYAQLVPYSASTYHYWSFGLDGMPLPGSPVQDHDALVKDSTDIDDDGIFETSWEATGFGHFDVNGDGYPDRITASGKELRIELWNQTTKTFVTNPGSSKSISASDVQTWAAWDMDGDGRLEVLSADQSMKVYCHELGEGTWDKTHMLPPHMTPHLRTNQWDNYEPNEGQDSNGDGVPDQFIPIPSALTAKGDFYGYLSSATDKDFYLLDTNYYGATCLTSPKNRSYTMRVYSFDDKVAPTGPDGLVWSDTSNATTKCFYSTSVVPARYGEFKFVVGIESQGTFSTAWPYWISAPK